jgi:coenzyme PQQ precursor peptide PqqA
MIAGLELGLAEPQNRSGTTSPRKSSSAPVPPRRRLTMQWQTPTATDFRFGFEITLYVSNR